MRLREIADASMKVLCVAEKPAIAKAIASALSGGSTRRRQTPSKYVSNIDLSYTFPQWGPCEVTVTSVLGHLSDIEFEEPFNNWKTPPVQLFSAPIRKKVQNEQVARNIREESRKARALYIWTDCDREGEHIGGEIVEEARKTNPQIQIWRAIFNNVDSGHLRHAAAHPAQLDWRQVEAVNVRRELDLRSGFSLSRFTTTLFQAHFPRLSREKAISYGSCQFPTLGFVVERYLRIKNHQPEPFWYIALNIRHPGGEKKPLSPTWDRGHLFDRAVAFTYYERALKHGEKVVTVEKVDSRPTSRYRPLPLTTVSLQKVGTAKLKMSAKKIMDVAEKLYQAGFISYPRTETDRFPPEMDLKKLVNNQRTNGAWGAYASSLLDNNKFRQPRQGKHDDKAHPPIHPVRGVGDGASSLRPDEKKVYEFVTRTFLACCSDDARGLATTITFDYGSEIFNLSGDRVVEPNFLDVYPYQKWTGTQLPELVVGQRLDVISAMLKEGRTTPPQPLTEADLIALMDSNGIGTDATMADHIDKILDREFVTKEREKFYPTTLGVALVQGYDIIGLEKSLAKPALRRDTETAVTRVAEGQSPHLEVKSQLVAQYEGMYRLAEERRQQLIAEARKYLDG